MIRCLKSFVIFAKMLLTNLIFKQMKMFMEFLGHFIESPSKAYNKHTHTQYLYIYYNSLFYLKVLG